MKTKTNAVVNEIIIDPQKIQKQVHEDFFNFEKASYTSTLSDAKSHYSGNNDGEVEKQDLPEKNVNSSVSEDKVLDDLGKSLEPSDSSKQSNDNVMGEKLNIISAKPELPENVTVLEKSSIEPKDEIIKNNKNVVTQKEENLSDSSCHLDHVIVSLESNNELGGTETPTTNKISYDASTSIEENKQSELDSWRLKIPPKEVDLLTDEEIENIYLTFSEKVKSVPEENREKWLEERVRMHFGDKMPSSLMDIVVGECFEGDSGISMDLKPEWLDLDKFRKGQKFALDYLFGINYADLLSLITVFSFKDGLKPLIFTQASSTPYTAFKRYASTGKRVYNWYNSDPWTPGTDAYNDIKSVRRIHAQVRKRLINASKEEFASKTTIKDAWCPSLEISRQDFEASCPAPAPGQCPYMIFEKAQHFKFFKLNQGEMIATQFAFVGLFILNPKFFGAHYATDEELEAFCHVWRGIGYLLGIEDRFNFCRGSLEDIKTRSRDFLESWVKPNFRTVTPEWEHMMRCVIEGLQYYFPGATYEIVLLDLAEMMNLHMPRLYNSLSYSLWIRRGMMRFTFNHFCKLERFRESFNKHLIRSLERGNNFDENKHKELKKRSARTLNNYKQERESNKSVLKEKGSWALRYLTQIVLEL